MLTVRDIASLPGLGLEVAAGADGLDREVRWLHVSELADPTTWLEGGELLLTTGLGVGASDDEKREYVRRLAGHDLAGLAFGLGFGFGDVPAALAAEADDLDFPVVSVPYDVPFIAITKAAFSQLASDELERLTQALEVHERLSKTVLEGRGVQALLGILCDRLGCSLALVDDAGRTIGERHAGRRVSFERALELPVVANEERATLRIVRPGRPLGDYDRLVLHHGQTALAFELARRHAVYCRRDNARMMVALRLEFSSREHPLGDAVRREMAELVERVRKLIVAGRRDGSIPPGPPTKVLAAACLAAVEAAVIALAGRVDDDEEIAQRVALGLLNAGPA